MGWGARTQPPCVCVTTPVAPAHARSRDAPRLSQAANLSLNLFEFISTLVRIGFYRANPTHGMKGDKGELTPVPQAFQLLLTVPAAQTPPAPCLSLPAPLHVVASLPFPRERTPYAVGAPLPSTPRRIMVTDFPTHPSPHATAPSPPLTP